MKKRIIICILTLGVIAFLLIRFDDIRSEDTNPNSGNEGAGESVEHVASGSTKEMEDAPVAALSEPIDNAAAEAKFMAAFKTPIAFFGRVIDQNGNAVSSAAIKITLADKPLESGSNLSLQSDTNGFFSIEDNGAAISVEVSKDEYYQTDESKGVFRYATPNRTALPTKLNPAIFVLHEKGKQAELIEVEARFRVSKSGSPTTVDLVTGNRGAESQTSLTVKAWTYDNEKNDQGRYDWEVNLSAKGGGLTEREERFNFTAPEVGYNEIEKIVMSQDGENWSPNKGKDYFVKLSNGNYARIRFRMIAGGDNFFTLKSWYNPSGSTNLE
jgi:hypothetical protein